jgi:hypothetical protein
MSGRRAALCEAYAVLQHTATPQRQAQEALIAQVSRGAAAHSNESRAASGEVLYCMDWLVTFTACLPRRLRALRDRLPCRHPCKARRTKERRITSCRSIRHFL